MRGWQTWMDTWLSLALDSFWMVESLNPCLPPFIFIFFNLKYSLTVQNQLSIQPPDQISTLFQISIILRNIRNEKLHKRLINNERKTTLILLEWNKIFIINSLAYWMKLNITQHVESESLWCGYNVLIVFKIQYPPSIKFQTQHSKILLKIFLLHIKY